MTFKSLLTNYNFVLKFCTIFGFLNFHFSHIIYEKFNLYLQNTLNMLKTTRVYFGVLHERLRNRGSTRAKKGKNISGYLLCELDLE